MDFVIKLFRGIFYTLDSIVYGLIPSVYSLLIQISRTSIFTQVEISAFAKRIYALIGVFMLFKVSVSIINYILNPDDFVDKEKGFTNIIKRIVLSLVMLVIAPYIFEEAFNLQSIILEENTIMNLVFGSPSDMHSGGHEANSSNSSYVDRAGKKIQFTLMYAFAQPNYQEFQNANYDLVTCENAYKKDGDNNYVFRSSSVTSSGVSSYIYELDEQCWGVYDPTNDQYVNDGTNGRLMQLFEENDAGDAFQNYAQGVAQQSFSLFFRKDVVTARTDDGRYLVNYRLGISTAVGVATLYLFLMFCVDIAVRSIQWGFLQMISPIPILSYCDPKSGKDGMFKKWFDKCKKVYLDLFIRLFALYFGIYIISLIGTFRDVVTHEEVSISDNWILSIFMILGVLMFVKKLPDFLKETLALDGSGMFKGYMNPLKKIEDEAVGGKLIGGAGKKTLGLATGAAAGLAGGLVTGRGLAAGIKAGMAGGWKGDKFLKNMSSAKAAGLERRDKLRDMRLDGVKRGEVFGAKVQSAVGMRTRGERADALDANLKAYTENGEAIKNAIYANDKAAGSLTANGKTFDGAKALKEFIDQMQAPVQQMGESASAFATRQQNFLAERKKFQDALDARVSEIATGRDKINDGSGGTAGGAAAQAAVEKLVKTMDVQVKTINAEGHSLYGSEYSDIGTISGTAGTALKNSLGAAAGAKTTVSSHAGHDRDVQKYAGTKKK